jgi:AbrB family looped-hinge helix DNA binding protein
MKKKPDRASPDELRPEYDFSKLKPTHFSKYPRYVMVRTVSSKGQITLPAEIRARMGLLPGTEVTVELTTAGTLIRKSPRKR